MAAALRSFGDALNHLLTGTAIVWWRCLPRLLTTVLLGWLGYRVFAALAAIVVDAGAWWSLLLLSTGFVINLSAIIIGLRIAGQQLGVREVLPLAGGDPRDDSIAHLLSITLLPFLGIYAVFDVITRAANDITVDYYVFHGLTFERPVLSQLNPRAENNSLWLILGVIVGLYLLRRLVEWWFDRTGLRPLGLLTALIEGFFLLIVVLSGRQLLVSLRAWIDERAFRVWLDYPRWGLQQLFAGLGIDITGVLDRIAALWQDVIWPGITVMVVEPMLWLALAALVFGTRVVSAADLWRRGRPLTVPTGRRRLQVGDGQRRFALELQSAFFGDLNDKYLPTFQSIRLVLGVGSTFFGAFVVVHGLLITGQDWLRRGIYLTLGGHEAAFWAVAGWPIDLVCTVLFEPVRWALLAVAFHACLTFFAARARDEAAQPEEVR